MVNDVTDEIDVTERTRRLLSAALRSAAQLVEVSGVRLLDDDAEHAKALAVVNIVADVISNGFFDIVNHSALLKSAASSLATCGIHQLYALVVEATTYYCSCAMGAVNDTVSMCRLESASSMLYDVRMAVIEKAGLTLSDDGVSVKYKEVTK